MHFSDEEDWITILPGTYRKVLCHNPYIQVTLIKEPEYGDEEKVQALIEKLDGKQGVDQNFSWSVEFNAFDTPESRLEKWDGLEEDIFATVSRWLSKSSKHNKQLFSEEDVYNIRKLLNYEEQINNTYNNLYKDKLIEVEVVPSGNIVVSYKLFTYDEILSPRVIDRERYTSTYEDAMDVLKVLHRHYESYWKYGKPVKELKFLR